jgi:hypothetical protein
MGLTVGPAHAGRPRSLGLSLGQKEGRAEGLCEFMGEREHLQLQGLLGPEVAEQPALGQLDLAGQRAGGQAGQSEPAGQ